MSKSTEQKEKNPEATTDELPECFIIMPISDPEGYQSGHFGQVFADLIEPACISAGYKAIRADQVKETNLIHVDMLKRLLDAPMAICDLSSRNPNVLFELGVRQAFDKPVVLIQEEGTQRIFDISLLRIISYKSELKYREVLHDQKVIADSIKATAVAKPEAGSVNSLIQLLAITVAKLPVINANDVESVQFQLIREELSQLRNIINKLTSQQFVSTTELAINPNVLYNALVAEFLGVQQRFLSKSIDIFEARRLLIDLQMRVRLHNKRENSLEIKDKFGRLDKELNGLLSQVKNAMPPLPPIAEEPPF
jgi:hypothetical protein